jgi:hypothetical protein
MVILSFKLGQLCMLLVPDLVDVVAGAAGTFSFPSEPNFVQKFLSVRSNFVIDTTFPLRTNPLP